MSLSLVEQNYSTDEILGMRRSIKIKTAAKVLDCNETTVRRLLSRGYLEGHKIGRDVRVFADSIDDYRNRNRVTTHPIETNNSFQYCNSASHRQAMANLKKRGII